MALRHHIYIVSIGFGFVAVADLPANLVPGIQ